MIKFIGYKKVEGVSKTTQKNYSFFVGYFTKDPDPNNWTQEGSSCFESIVSQHFVDSFKIGDVLKEVYYNERKHIVFGLK